jgi:uncharacterized repeat protein (TIGR01451 family)
MRATEGNRRVSTWRKLAGVIAAAALALSIFGGGTVSAATPSWKMTVTPTPSKVTTGESAGYVVQIFNTGKSNISQVFLTDGLVKLDDGTLAIPAQILPTTFISTSQGTCDSLGTRLNCALGAIRARNSATVTVAFSTGTNSVLQRIFEVNTTGVAGDNPGSSHGDVLQGVGTTTTGTGDDFAGRFIVDNSVVVNDFLTLGNRNLQSTKVNVPAGAHGVSVADGNDASPIDCPVTTPCWSQTSEVHVDNGATFSSGFSVEIGIYRDLSQTVHGVYHQFDTPHNGVAGETLSACPKHGAPSHCFTVVKTGAGNILVTVYLTENGKIGNF